MELHHNSYALRMARIIVPVGKRGGRGLSSWPIRRPRARDRPSSSPVGPHRATVSLARATRAVPTIGVRNQAIGKAGLEAKA